MKALLLVALCLMTSLQARPPHSEERSMDEEIMNFHQNGKINAAMVNMADLKIMEAETRAVEAIGNLGEPASHMEGKILAVIINQIEENLELAKAKRNALMDKAVIVDRDLQEIDTLIELIDTRINEL